MKETNDRSNEQLVALKGVGQVSIQEHGRKTDKNGKNKVNRRRQESTRCYGSS